MPHGTRPGIEPRTPSLQRQMSQSAQTDPPPPRRSCCATNTRPRACVRALEGAHKRCAGGVGGRDRSSQRLQHDIARVRVGRARVQHDIARVRGDRARVQHGIARVRGGRARVRVGRARVRVGRARVHNGLARPQRVPLTSAQRGRGSLRDRCPSPRPRPPSSKPARSGARRSRPPAARRRGGLTPAPAVIPRPHPCRAAAKPSAW